MKFTIVKIKPEAVYEGKAYCYNLIAKDGNGKTFYLFDPSDYAKNLNVGDIIDCRLYALCYSLERQAEQDVEITGILHKHVPDKFAKKAEKNSMCMEYQNEYIILDGTMYNPYLIKYCGQYITLYFQGHIYLQDVIKNSEDSDK